MELGEVVCLPNGAALCSKCPLKEECRAFSEGLTEVLPIRQVRQEKLTEQKTVLVNEAHALLRRCCAATADDARLEQWTVRMNELYDDFLDDVNEYNFYVRRYNQKLETRAGAVVADMLRLKHLTIMDDLRL